MEKCPVRISVGLAPPVVGGTLKPPSSLLSAMSLLSHPPLLCWLLHGAPVSRLCSTCFYMSNHFCFLKYESETPSMCPAPHTWAHPPEPQSFDSCDVCALFCVNRVDARDHLVLPKSEFKAVCAPARGEHTPVATVAESELSCNLVPRVVFELIGGCSLRTSCCCVSCKRVR